MTSGLTLLSPAKIYVFRPIDKETESELKRPKPGEEQEEGKGKGRRRDVHQKPSCCKNENTP